MDWFLSKLGLANMEDEQENNQVFFKEVQTYTDCKQVLDNYKMKAACIFTLNPATNPEARGMMKYICGGVYALDGEISCVGENVFMTIHSVIS